MDGSMEDLRNELHKLLKNQIIISDKILQISRELDRLNYENFMMQIEQQQNYRYNSRTKT